MTTTSINVASDNSITISLPIKMKRYSGHILITSPKLTRQPDVWDTKPTTLQRALAKGYQWLKLLEEGKLTSIKEISLQENVTNSYVSRMINLTSLAPDIIATILDGDMPEQLDIKDISINPPKLWSQQRTKFLCAGNGGNSNASAA